MMYSSLGSTNISYAAAFVYLSVKDKSRRKTSTAPIAFDVYSDIGVSCYKHLIVHSFTFVDSSSCSRRS